MENNIEVLAQRKPEVKSELQYLNKEVGKLQERMN
jgi:hypothetical protein